MICICGTKMIENNDKITISLRNEKYSITNYFFSCPHCPEEYSNSVKNDEELTKIFNQYRLKYNMLDPEQITTLRLKLGKSIGQMLSEADIHESFRYLESRGCLLTNDADTSLQQYFKSFNLI